MTQFRRRILLVIPAVKQVLDNKNTSDTKELANCFCIGRNALQAAFKQECGLGIRKYKLKQRMEQATQMLIEGKGIKEIAFTLKYSESRAFSRAFKKYYGVLPTEWNETVQTVTNKCKL